MEFKPRQGRQMLKNIVSRSFISPKMLWVYSSLVQPPTIYSSENETDQKWITPNCINYGRPL